MPRRKEGLVYGLHACQAVATHRPEAILRVFFHRRHRVALGPLLKATAAQRRPYREVGSEDLEKLAGTQHHEGVVVFTEPLPLLDVDGLMDRLGPPPLIVAVDGVGNPHNLGAILRSAAWFGADAVVFKAQPGQGTLNGATLRVAQGGAEHLLLCGVQTLGPALATLARAGCAVVGADQTAERGLDAPFRRPVCLVMGAEGDGLSDDARRALTSTVRIPGTRAVESLNVAVATGILLANVVD